MTLVVIAVVATVALAIGFAIASMRTRHRVADHPSTPSDTWLATARSVVQDGYELAAGMTDHAERDPTGLSDDAVTQLVSALGDFSRQVAAISATAPTATDTRVCRVLGVRVRALGDVYEREMRVRQALGTGRRSVLAADAQQQPAERLDEFEVALRDLDEHVELY